MIRFLFALALIGLPSLAHAANRSFIVGSFDTVRVDGPFRVTLKTNTSPAATATGSQQALDSLTIQVESGTLVVSLGAGNWSNDSGQMLVPPTIMLATHAIRTAIVNSGAELSIDKMSGQMLTLSVNGSGTLDVGAIDTPQLRATVVGAGAMTLAGAADKAQFQISGPGSVSAEKLLARDLTVRLDGSGEAHFAAKYTADITTTGLGLVTVAGTPACTVHAAAGGPVRCGKQVH